MTIENKLREGHIAYSPEICEIRTILAKYLPEYKADLLGELADLLSFAQQELLEKFRGCVGERSEDTDFAPLKAGWNAHRQATLEKLDLLTKEIKGE